MTSPFGGDGANPMDVPKRPSAAGFWLGGILIVVGIAGGIAWGAIGFNSMLDTIDDFERVPAGSVGTIELDAGEYVVYAERGGGQPTGLFLNEVRMRPAGEEGAEEITFDAYTSEVTYDFGNNHTGRAQLTFTIDEGGEYDVRVDDGPGTTATTAAFGPSIADDLVSAIVGGFVIAGVGILLGVVLLIVTGIRRRKYRQRGWLDALNGPGGSGTPQAGGWNPPPPQATGWSGNPPPPAGYPPPPTGGGFPPPNV